VVAKVRDRLAVSKQAAQKLDREIFNLGKLNELQVSKQYQIEISNRFAGLENLSDGEDIKGLGRTLKRISKPQLKRV
jgi:hypothetical protein